MGPVLGYTVSWQGSGLLFSYILCICFLLLFGVLLRTNEQQMISIVAEFADSVHGNGRVSYRVCCSLFSEDDRWYLKWS